MRLEKVSFFSILKVLFINYELISVYRFEVYTSNLHYRSYSQSYMQKKEYTLEVAGKTLKATFSDLADQAHGSVIISYGETALLVTAVMGKKEGEADFFPLTVDFEERFYAAGKILGSQFIRREGKPSDDAVLSGRVVDRTIRPLFNQQIRYPIQVILTALAMGEEDPDTLGVIGASLALITSNIPFNGPVSGVHVGKVGERVVINPTYTERTEASFDITACGKDGNINMIETVASEISNEDAMNALTLASEEIEKIQKWQNQIAKEFNVTKREVPQVILGQEVETLFGEVVAKDFAQAVFSGPGKENIYALKEVWMKTATEKFPDTKKGLLDEYFEEKLNDIIHEEAIKNGKRPDGRGLDDLRELSAQAGGISPILHGSGVFYRGGTHVFSALTLGGPEDVQIVDNMEGSHERRFMHHYNFPPFSTGETGRSGGQNRRAIGHGNLAEKALLAVLPSKDKFPYTIRIVSEAFASNGSTSMASVCGSSLALMDAGVPITKHVAGIASGLMMKNENEYAVLTDIQGPEDHHGDMDFKVAGTRDGITAIQMDVKVDGIPLSVLKIAFEKATSARNRILDVLEKAIASPRTDISARAPKILSTKIKQDQIGLVIGSGGKTIKEIKEKTGAEITIEDDGTVYVTGVNGSAEKAKAIIEDMTHEYKAGETFEGVVTRILDFGAFVKIGHTAEGLVHVSEIAPFRIEKVTDYVKEGMIVPVVVKEVDEKGRVNLSIKRINDKFFTQK